MTLNKLICGVRGVPAITLGAFHTIFAHKQESSLPTNVTFCCHTSTCDTMSHKQLKPFHPSSSYLTDMFHKSCKGKDKSFDHIPLLRDENACSLFQLPPLQPSFQEPTISDMISKAEMFCKDRDSGKIDVKTTHLPYLVNDVKYNFYTIFPDKDLHLYDAATQQDILQFKKEMHARIQTKTLTYEWWFLFHYRLSILATCPEQRSVYLVGSSFVTKEIEDFFIKNRWKDHETTVQLFSNYITSPFFLYPTTLGNISIEDMNTMFGTKVWAIGLVNKPIAADGSIMNPDEFFRHDIGHMSSVKMTQQKYASYYPTDKEIAALKEKFSYLKEILRTLPNQDPNKTASLITLLDFVFFYLHHESRYSILSLWTAYHDHAEIIVESSLTQPWKWFKRIINYFFISDSLGELMSDKAFLRKDVFKDILPDPKELGLASYPQMCEFALEVLFLLLPIDNQLTKETLAENIETILQNCTSHPEITDIQKQYTRSVLYELNPYQIDIHNTCIQFVNEGKFALAQESMPASYPSYARELINAYAKTEIEQAARAEACDTVKIDRLMNAIDNSYLG